MIIRYSISPLYYRLVVAPHIFLSLYNCTYVQFVYGIQFFRSKVPHIRALIHTHAHTNTAGKCLRLQKFVQCSRIMFIVYFILFVSTVVVVHCTLQLCGLTLSYKYIRGVSYKYRYAAYSSYTIKWKRCMVIPKKTCVCTTLKTR